MLGKPMRSGWIWIAALRNAALAAAPVLLLGACSAGSTHSHLPAGPASGTPLKRDDVLWMQRVTFGLDSSSIAEYRRLGREHYLDNQLAPEDGELPPAVAAAIDKLEISHLDVVQTLREVNERYKTINAMDDISAKEDARKVLNEHGNQLAREAAGRELLRALYSRGQLKEQLVWFWLDHFSVYQNKANLRWLVADYAERAIRPHALGHFRDLVMATLEHPAMLQYLDNNQNAAGHLNENYARELMELHILGVDGGYTQQDVQELARVLTGVGVNAGNAPKLKREWQPLYRRDGAFEFNPARHDFGPKVLLGRRIAGQGFPEVEESVALMVRQPACARYISRELATYFLADEPPAPLVARMAQTFLRTDGDIAALMRTLFSSRELQASLGGKFKDPMRFVLSAVRLAYDGRIVVNTRPLSNWLSSLGEAPFGRLTPDGYPLTETAWASSGQMSRRFEIARSIGSGNAGLFDTDGGAPGAPGFPQLSNRLYFEAIEPFLTAHTKEALARANSQQEWNTFLLASPDFNYE
jgi:uncharacterized protein (DUF1800 family)